MSNGQRNIKQKSTILAIILVIYIYVPYFANILENTFKISSLYEYIIYMMLAIIAIGTTMSMNKRVLTFLFVFCSAIIINYIVVPYRYYVFIEGIQALVGIAVPCLCVSNNIFDLRIFVEKWWKFSKLNLPLVLVAVVLLKQGLVHYSIFTSICVPNVFIGSYMVLQGIEKRKWLYINVAAMYCIAVEFALVRGKITEEQYAYYISELLTIASKINKILEDKERLQWFAAKYAGAHDVFFVGRGIDYAVSLEGSLKLKEISYIHSEAYAAGELKHGTISLIEPGTLVIGVLTQSKLYEKTMSNMVECRSRGAYLLGLTTYGKYEIEETVDFAVYVPRIDEYFAGSLAVVPLQLLGYYVSVAKGLDVDKPRNLAKSVTVE